jgi:hypothetical protein
MWTHGYSFPFRNVHENSRLPLQTSNNVSVYVKIDIREDASQLSVQIFCVTCGSSPQLDLSYVSLICHDACSNIESVGQNALTLLSMSTIPFGVTNTMSDKMSALFGFTVQSYQITPCNDVALYCFTYFVQNLSVSSIRYPFAMLPSECAKVPHVIFQSLHVPLNWIHPTAVDMPTYEKVFNKMY